MNPKGKVLYLTYDGLTDPLGQAQILPYILGLTTIGFSFQIVSFEKKGVFKQYEHEVNERIKDKSIEWFPLPYTKFPPVLSTVFDLWRMKRTAKKLAKNANIIHCRSYLPMLVATSGISVNKLVFDMRGLWADERVEGRLWPQDKVLYKAIYSFMRKKEKLFLQQADAIVSLTQDGINALTERYGQQPFIKKTTVIPCCVDTKLFNRANIDVDLKISLGLSAEAKVLIHVGSVGTWYRLDQELRFFEALKHADASWHFLILTQDRDQAQRIVQEGIHEQVLVLGVPYQEVRLFLGIAHASIQFIEPSFAKRASSPVKFGEALAMGLPVITNQGIGDLYSIMQDKTLGVCISNWDEIPEAAAGFDTKAYDAEKIRSFALEQLSLEQGIASYNHVYQTIINHD